MKESYAEGPASHGDPESCVRPSDGPGEALTGAHTGEVLSREIRQSQGADAVVLSGRLHPHERNGEFMETPARSETFSMCGNSMRENRETSLPPPRNGPGGRVGKAIGHTPAMHGSEESDRPIVPAKSPNKPGQPGAEAMEGRGLVKENTGQQNTLRTQRREGVPSALDRVRQAAQRKKAERFSALFHHVTQERLREAFMNIKRKATPGIDLRRSPKSGHSCSP